MPVKTLVGLAAFSIAFYFLPTFLGESFSSLARELAMLARSMS
jgi:hypothetical protein